MKNRNKFNVLNDEECVAIVRKKLTQDLMNDFELVSYEVIPVDATTGYMGQYFTLKTIVARANSPDDTKIINFFTKIPPPNNSPQYEFSEEQGSFKKEVELYTRVFPIVLQGLDKYYIPECFLGLQGDIIVLEDMTPRGYLMPDKFIPFDLDHCRIIMKTMARFHARSIIYEENYRKNISAEFSQCLHETLWPLKEGRAQAMFFAAVKGVISLIDHVDGLDKEAKDEFKEKLMSLAMEHAKKLLPSKIFRNVICHGDLWANNILFKYDNVGKPTACCLIDFQLARYNPPAHDIMTFLQFTTTRKLRDDHSCDLFKIYYESLAAVLEEAGINYTTILPWKEFLNSIEQIRTMCMVHGILNTPIMLLEAEAVSKYFNKEPELLETLLYVDRTPLVCEQFRDVKRYRDRLQDGLLELYERIMG